jgi:hypothetical protein
MAPAGLGVSAARCCTRGYLDPGPRRLRASGEACDDGAQAARELRVTWPLGLPPCECARAGKDVLASSATSRDRRPPDRIRRRSLKSATDESRRRSPSEAVSSALGAVIAGKSDNEAMTFVNQVYQRAGAFLFGRRTYELFAGYWGVQSGNPIAAALNRRPKYVASAKLADPQWADTTVLSGDAAAAIGEPKARP